MEAPLDLMGEGRLQDRESFAPVEATITPAVLKTYRRLLTAFSNEAADFCRRRGMLYLQLRSDVRLQDVLVRTFRTAGILVSLVGFLAPAAFLVGGALLLAILATYLWRPPRPSRRVSGTFFC